MNTNIYHHNKIMNINICHDKRLRTFKTQSLILSWTVWLCDQTDKTHDF